MTKDLVLKSTTKGVEIALIEDRKLVELHQEDNSNKYTVGDLFVGQIKKVIPSLNAAFVDVGYHRDAFLHYTDLGPNVRSLLKLTHLATKGQARRDLKDFRFEKEIVKTGKVNEVLEPRQKILVQILKEPISNKGPRLSSEVNLAGRFLVLTPFSNVLSISKKIMSREERKRLLRLVESIKPDNFGVIIRTVAEGKKVSELHEDLTDLMKKWGGLMENLDGVRPPKKVLHEEDRASTILRDLLDDKFNKITVNDPGMYEDVRTQVSKIFPGKEKMVSLYKGRGPIFDHFDVTRQIKASFGTTVSMPSGAYLIIEHTEAMHIVDVNSGHKVSKDENQEQTALKVNLEAVEMVARQARLRDLGGIVVIDFIDMKKTENKKKVFEAMKKHMDTDRAKHTILPLSKFCLMQITRQRVRPEINIKTKETCPSCNGTGKMQASILAIDDIQNNIEFLISEQNQKHLELHVNPFIFAYIKKGFPSLQMKWYFRFNKWVKVRENHDLAFMDYHFYDKAGEQISL